jgi:hypothetical protein
VVADVVEIGKTSLPFPMLSESIGMGAEVLIAVARFIALRKLTR